MTLAIHQCIYNTGRWGQCPLCHHMMTPGTGPFVCLSTELSQYVSPGEREITEFLPIPKTFMYTLTFLQVCFLHPLQKISGFTPKARASYLLQGSNSARFFFLLLPSITWLHTSWHWLCGISMYMILFYTWITSTYEHLNLFKKVEHPFSLEHGFLTWTHTYISKVSVHRILEVHDWERKKTHL